jgi:hypothetical protein
VDGVRQLGVTLPGQGLRGGPVYDVAGRLAGVAQGGVGDRLITIGALRAGFGGRFGTVTAAALATPIATDELYERAMKTTLQLLVAPAPARP